tara:strand:- start:927 stop:1145 length:219 start_codon:yes stop_codon:yes gene_type:complete
MSWKKIMKQDELQDAIQGLNDLLEGINGDTKQMQMFEQRNPSLKGKMYNIPLQEKRANFLSEIIKKLEQMNR